MADGRTLETAISRPGGRVVLLDAAGRVLLILSEFDGREMWFTPGGALDVGESFEDAALRELREEVGLESVTLGPCVWLRRATWHWGECDTWYATLERFYLVRLDHEAPQSHLAAGRDEIMTLNEARWWSLDDLRASGEAVSPLALLDLLAPLVRGELPEAPIEIGL